MGTSRLRLERWTVLLTGIVFAAILLRTAWICDDAYITFRTVDNVIAGFGPRWNAAERVQGYTHPLWMLLLLPVDFVVRETYFSAIGLSLACSLAAVGLMALRAITPWHRLGALLALAGSKAFVDYSSSGLENPLSHLLTVVLLVTIASLPRRRPWLPVFIASLLLLSRLDLVWLAAPMVGWWLMTEPAARRWRALAIGLSPLIVWESFSLFYYGFLVPNTAFAKLQTGVEIGARLMQGLRYLQESMRADPLTLTLIAISIVAGLWRRGLWAAVALGQSLLLGYIVWIGGDFMSGRHLTVPFLAGVMTLSAMPIHPRPAVRLVAIAALALAHLLLATSNITSGPEFGMGSPYREFHGIADERQYYYPRTGLLRASTPLTPPVIVEGEVARAMLSAGQTVATRDAIGMFGYAAGPRLHIVDWYALTDPLLARLPALPGSRIGHFRRELPDGYIQTLRSGQNQIRDPEVARTWDRLVLITRGPLWSTGRMRAILSMNLPF